MTVSRGLAAAALALLLAACADSVPAGEEGRTLTDSKTDGPQPVSFSTYTQRSTTRAGLGGEMSTAALQTGVHKTEGFGVFAYYHDDYVYDGQGLPDFMWNQQVAYKAAGGVPAGFYYEPLRYWPNETGGNAQSDRVDRVSFFAYAPYVAVDADTGIPDGAVYGETGITAVSRNSRRGDPAVNYRISTDPATGVDLCWAEPVMNKTRMDYGGGTTKVTFKFHHALAKLNVTVDAQVDDLSASDDPAGGALTADGQTRVYVRSVTFTGLAAEGALNLNSSIYTDLSKPRWQGTDGTASVKKDPVTIHDGRYDGMEGSIADEGETLGGHCLNSDIIQSTTWADASAAPGVTRTPLNLFGTSATAATAPIYVIPTGEPMTVTIVYDIETEDDLPETLSDLSTQGISIENKITKAITTTAGDLRLESGKLYTVNLHLGLNSVKFDAAVTDWETVEVVELASWDIGYKAGVQTFTVPEKGTYRLEAWGAAGGKQVSINGGSGGYSEVVVDLDPADTPTLYIYTGGMGGNVTAATGNREAYGSGGWNGGGNGGAGDATRNYNGAAGGGGATHIATSSIGVITASNDLHTGDGTTAKDGLLVVAGGGGGAARYGNIGAGGGLTGGLGGTRGNASYFSGADAWKNGKHSVGANGARGGTGSYGAEGHGGGGGGFIGGNTITVLTNANNTVSGGCGGSGWLSPTAKSGSTTTGVNTGNGRVRICLLGGASDLPGN